MEQRKEEQRETTAGSSTDDIMVSVQRQIMQKEKEQEEEEERLKRERYVAPEQKLLADEARERGNVLFREKKWEEACEAYTEAAIRDPTQSLPLQNRGLCHVRTGDYIAAIKDYTECMEQATSVPLKALYWRAKCYLEIGDYEQAFNDAMFLQVVSTTVDYKKAGEEIIKQCVDKLPCLHHSAESVGSGTNEKDEEQ